MWKVQRLDVSGYTRQGFSELKLCMLKVKSILTGDGDVSKLNSYHIIMTIRRRYMIGMFQSVKHTISPIVKPLDGKASGGGLKIGEMERDVLCSHGSTKFLQEKFFDHSDGFTEYICRCGKSAVVNNEKGIYKCKYCKDNADIHGVPTSWSSKLFMQEMETMNVGIKRHLTPFTYESVQEETKE